MPYVKPGVEITQVEATQSPVLTTPELDSVILGTPVGWIDPNNENIHDSVTELTIAAAAAPAYDLVALYSTVDPDITAGSIIAGTIVVDLVLNTPASGQTLVKGTKIHLTGLSAIDGVVTVPNTVNLVSNGITYHTILGDKYLVSFGFLYKKASGLGFKTFDNAGDMADELGELKSWNPLGFGAKLAVMNSGKSTKTFGFASAASVDIAEVAELLALQEVYSIALMKTDDDDAETLVAHCVTQSQPENKKERIVFINLDNATSLGNLSTSSLRSIAATNISLKSGAIGNKRAFNVFPNIAYVKEFRHISTILNSWLVASFADSANTLILENGIYAKLAKAQKGLINSYKAGQDITEAVWADLVKAGVGATDNIEVLVPVPGYYYTAAAAGKAIGVAIEQPLTNSSIAGFAKTVGSLDSFSEANLNTIAAGGTFIFVQDTPSTPIYCRHQLSTDVLTVQRRELSITRQVDYVAKTFRNILKAYAGKFNITPSFIALVTSVLSGLSSTLVRKGSIADIVVNNVYQDDISPDTLRAEVTVTVKYPANYIKIDLIV